VQSAALITAMYISFICANQSLTS